MWKDYYLLGVEHIDRQHKTLFEQVQSLIEAIERQEGPSCCRQTVAFVREYALFHFRDEEAFFETLHYPGLDLHKRAHKRFVMVLEEYAQLLERTGYDIHVVREFAGTLTAWLIYHIAYADARPLRSGALSPAPVLSPLAALVDSVREMLQRMAGVDASAVEEYDTVGKESLGSMVVRIGVSGSYNGSAIFGFTDRFARNLMHSMTGILPDTLDEMTCSVVSEFSNIVVGRAMAVLSQRGIICDITPPATSTSPDDTLAPGAVVLETSIGQLRLAVEDAH